MMGEIYNIFRAKSSEGKESVVAYIAISPEEEINLRLGAAIITQAAVKRTITGIKYQGWCKEEDEILKTSKNLREAINRLNLAGLQERTYRSTSSRYYRLRREITAETPAIQEAPQKKGMAFKKGDKVRHVNPSIITSGVGCVQRSNAISRDYLVLFDKSLEWVNETNLKDAV